MNEKEKITAIILAGGKSSRMGTEKGLVELNRKCLIEYVIDTAKKISEEVIIIANTNEYKRFGYTVFPDLIKNLGPMGGIYTGLSHSQTQNNFVLSCDIPFVSETVLKFLSDNSTGYEITVPVHHGKTEPLCGIYSKRCAEKFKMLMKKNELKMIQALKSFKVEYWNVSVQKFYNEKLFWNVNTKEELESV